MRENSIEVVFPKCNAIWNSASGGYWDRLDPNRYQAKPVATNIGSALFTDVTIDLSAFFVQDRTFFPSELISQSVGFVECASPAQWNNSASVIVYDIITSTPINPLQTLMDGVVAGDFPGFPEYPLDNQFILYGNYRVFAANSSNSFPGYMQMVQSNNFGSGLPTAAEKLYAYRIIIPDSDDVPTDGTLLVPATRYQILGMTDAEEELERVYRLRQSYEQLERS